MTPLLAMSVIAFVLCTLAFGEGLLFLAVKWGYREEYSHGYLIPAISLWLLWTRRSALPSAIGSPSASGVLLLFLSLNMLVFGEIAAISLFVQVGYLVALIGLTLIIGGFSLLRVCFFPIFFLGFAIPLPTFLESAISWRLQLISSELGVFFIRLFDVPVYLSGNVIDLGNYQLQVVEACSGLRYLFPLLSLGVLGAYFFKAPLWMRCVVVISTIPVTIVMNSIRIGVIGLTVDLWGTEMAEGALHFFEGWVIFMACSAVLALEVWLMTRFLLRKKFFDVVGPPPEPDIRPQAGPARDDRRRLVLLATGIAMIAVAYSLVFLKEATAEQVPERQRFIAFPSKIGQWSSRVSYLEKNIEEALLGLGDYILADFSHPKDPPVNLYIGYYPSQKKEHGPHNPRRCIPAGGWQISTLERREFVDDRLSERFPVTRTVIERGENRMLVYYWFEGRGRRIANQYMSKYYIYRDSFTRGRSDGSLVRVMTPVVRGEGIDVAETRLQKFISLMLPELPKYIPG